MGMTPEQAFRQEYGGSVNFMTPNVVRYGWIKKDQFAYEISKGLGFDNEPIYGITIVEVTANGKTQRRTDLGQMFFSMEEARAHIAALAQDAR